MDVAGIAAIAAVAEGTVKFRRENFGEAEDGVERRAQLVANLGKKLGLGARGLFGGIARRGEGALSGDGAAPIAHQGAGADRRAVAGADRRSDDLDRHQPPVVAMEHGRARTGEAERAMVRFDIPFAAVHLQELAALAAEQFLGGQPGEGAQSGVGTDDTAIGIDQHEGIGHLREDMLQHGPKIGEATVGLDLAGDVLAGTDVADEAPAGIVARHAGTADPGPLAARPDMLGDEVVERPAGTQVAGVTQHVAAVDTPGQRLGARPSEHLLDRHPGRPREARRYVCLAALPSASHTQSYGRSRKARSRSCEAVRRRACTIMRQHSKPSRASTAASAKAAATRPK